MSPSLLICHRPRLLPPARREEGGHCSSGLRPLGDAKLWKLHEDAFPPLPVKELHLLWGPKPLPLAGATSARLLSLSEHSAGTRFPLAGPWGTLAASAPTAHLSVWTRHAWSECVMTSQSARSVAQSCPALFDSLDCSTPGSPVHHHFPEPEQTRICRILL